MMLNRRLSNYIYYGSLALIALFVILLRVLIVGNQQDKIYDLEQDNIVLQDQIDELNEIVQENRDVQTSHLYELFDIVPNVYSSTSLTFTTVAMLEELGIDESDEFNRTVYVAPLEAVNNAELAALASKYQAVRVEVSFTTDDIAFVTDFIDMVQQHEQLFIVDDVSYTDTKGEYSIEMRIAFLAFYDVDLITEES